MVPFVVPRHRHDGSCAVGNQHIVRHPDGDRFVVRRVDGITPRENACFFYRQVCPLQVRFVNSFLDVVVNSGALCRRCDFGDERMFWCQHAVSRAEEGIRPRGKDGECAIAIHHVELNVCAFGLANPVALHFLEAIGPVKFPEVIEKSFGVGGDFKHPLTHEAAFHQIAGVDIFSVFDFLVGEDGAECWAPIDRDIGEVCQPFFIKAEEHPLRPFVVVRRRGVDFPGPVV